MNDEKIVHMLRLVMANQAALLTALGALAEHVECDDAAKILAAHSEIVIDQLAHPHPLSS